MPEMVKRDLLKDKALCDKATPGPWIIESCPAEFQALSWFVRTPVAEKDEQHLYTAAVLDGGPQDKCDVEFMADSRVGWPHAIDRAIAAESALERLAKDLAKIRENGDDISHGLRLVLKGYETIIQERDRLKSALSSAEQRYNEIAILLDEAGLGETEKDVAAVVQELADRASTLESELAAWGEVLDSLPEEERQALHEAQQRAMNYLRGEPHV